MDGKISGTKFSVKCSEKVMDEKERKNGLMSASASTLVRVLCSHITLEYRYR